MSPVPLGLAIMGAKATASSHYGGDKVNDEKYNLLGDPALVLAVPPLSVQLDDADSLALRRGEVVTISGTVLDSAAAAATWFDGTVSISSFDRADTTGYTYLDTLCFGSMVKHEPYTLLGRPIFTGEADVDAGRFEASFFVPIDARTGDLGRIGLYAVTGDSAVDAAGGYDSIAVLPEDPAGGSDDREGPAVAVTVDGREIADDLWFTGDSRFVIELEDESGINTMGNDFYFTVNIVVDGGEQIDLGERFAYEHGSYRKGSMSFRWSELEGVPAESGVHEIAFRASDNRNNRTEVAFRIRLVEEIEPLAFRSELLNHPNPFNPSVEETEFFVDLTARARVTIQIFTTTGRLIRELRDCRADGATILRDCPWDGRDQDGDPAGNGVYLIRATAESDDGSIKAESIGKAVILRDVRRVRSW